MNDKYFKINFRHFSRVAIPELKIGFKFYYHEMILQLDHGILRLFKKKLSKEPLIDENNDIMLCVYMYMRYLLDLYNNVQLYLLR